MNLCKEQLGWKPTTTYTVIKRLSERGILKNENSVVSALVTRDEVQAAEIDELVEKKFDGSLPAFLAAFTRHQKITEKEIDEVQRMIDRFREGRMRGLFLNIVNMSLSASWLIAAALSVSH